MKVHLLWKDENALLVTLFFYAVHTNLDPATFLASNSVLGTVFSSENDIKL